MRVWGLKRPQKTSNVSIFLDRSKVKGADLDLGLKVGLDLDLDLNIAGFAHHWPLINGNKDQVAATTFVFFDNVIFLLLNAKVIICHN